MAKEPQIGGAVAGVNIINEDYQPLSDWKEEPERNILLVHLPGMSCLNVLFCSFFS